MISLRRLVENVYVDTTCRIMVETNSVMKVPPRTMSSDVRDVE
jgi:hypothetical protein